MLFVAILVIFLIQYLSGQISADISSLLHVYSSYGNELQQAQLLWENKQSSFNYTDYFLDYLTCFDGVTINEQCGVGVNKWHRPQTILWEPPKQDDSDGHRGLDCKYVVSPAHLLNETHLGTLEYRFSIKQYDCKSSIFSLGGTTFDIFGYNSLFLTNCAYLDHTDNTYRVSCRAPYGHMSQSSLSYINSLEHDNSLLCISITIIINHEHFDTFSEVLSDQKQVGYLFPRRVIADNVTYCFSNVSNNKLNDEKKQNQHHNTSKYLTIPNNTVIYSTVWISKQLKRAGYASIVTNGSYNTLELENYYQKFGQSSYHTGYEYRIWDKSLTNLQPYHRQVDTTIPITALPPNVDTGDNYLYDVIALRGGNTESLNAIVEHISEVDLLSASLYNEHEITHHFIGASHARYFFDVFFENYFGVGKHNDSASSLAKNRKHGSMSANGLEYSYMQTAEECAAELLNICNNKSKKQATKVILHTGHWDLSRAGLRRYIKETRALPALLHVVQTILNSTIACSHVVEILWVLSVPYPLCYNDHGAAAECNNVRGYRFNPAIAASNIHVMNRLLQMERREPFTKLSIIDGLSIVKPRLLFNEDGEVVCMCHFVCRLWMWEDLKYDTPTVWTLGGKAMFDILLHALSN